MDDEPIELTAAETNCVVPGFCFCAAACEASSQTHLQARRAVVLVPIGSRRGRRRLGYLSPWACDCTGCEHMGALARRG